MVNLKVECGIHNYHSGEVGGIVPEAFNIVRTLINRLNNSETGEVTKEF